MFKIGITGGIGSGKSTACKIFESLGVPIYDTDTRAKILTNTLPEIKEEIIKIFGEKSYIGDIMDRRYIGDIIFANKEMLNILNNIIHPRVEKDYNNWCDENSNSIYTLKESAIMFESNSYKNLDKIIVVISPIEARIERIKSRDPQRSDDEILNIIKSQMSDEEKIKLSDYKIINETKENLYKQILDLDKEIKNYSIC